MSRDEYHVCEEYDQLNTCVECGEPKHDHERARRSGGAGSRTHPTTDREHREAMRNLMSRGGR